MHLSEVEVSQRAGGWLKDPTTTRISQELRMRRILRHHISLRFYEDMLG